MSTRSSLKGLSGSRVQVRDVPRVVSGSPGKFLLRSEPGKVRAPAAALALAKRHLSLREAHEIVTRLFDAGEAVVELAMVDSVDALTRELAASSVTAIAYGAPPKVDVRRIREDMHMSQEQFALEFGLELATLRNWEQYRSEPDTAARNFLVTIARNPKAVRQALAHEKSKT